MTMRITFRHPHAKVPRGLKKTAEEKVARLDRFLPDMERAEIIFSFEKNPRIADAHRCEVTMTGHGHVVRAHAAASEQVAALEKVIDKLETRLTRLKGKLVTRTHPHHRKLKSEVAAAKPKSLRTAGEVRGTSSSPGVRPSLVSPAPAPSQETKDAAEVPNVVKTKIFELDVLSPDDAAMRMDLVEHDFYLFMNADSGTASVVYRRADGEVGVLIAK